MKLTQSDTNTSFTGTTRKPQRESSASWRELDHASAADTSFPNRNFYTASIPTHRLHIHVKK